MTSELTDTNDQPEVIKLISLEFEAEPKTEKLNDGLTRLD